MTRTPVTDTSRTRPTPLFATAPAPPLRHGAPVRLLPAGASLWRVVDATGRIVGHLQAVSDVRGVRYRARRMHPLTHVFRDIGDFWSPDDAVDSLRFSR